MTAEEFLAIRDELVRTMGANASSAQAESLMKAGYVDDSAVLAALAPAPAPEEQGES